MLVNLGLAALNKGQVARSKECFEQAVIKAREAGDRIAEKNALERLGTWHSYQRDFPRALEFFQQALRLARAVGDYLHAANLLWHASVQHAELGDQKTALAVEGSGRALSKPGQAAGGLVRDASSGIPQRSTAGEFTPGSRNGLPGPGKPTRTRPGMAVVPPGQLTPPAFAAARFGGAGCRRAGWR